MGKVTRAPEFKETRRVRGTKESIKDDVNEQRVCYVTSERDSSRISHRKELGMRKKTDETEDGVEQTVFSHVQR